MSQVKVAGKELQDWVAKDLTAYVGSLEGRWLTIVDATFVDKEQRKAMKDIVRKMIWDWDTQICESVCTDYNVHNINK